MMRDPRADVHVMPRLPPGHPRAHVSSPTCWCGPEVYFVAENGNRAWLHKEIH